MQKPKFSMRLTSLMLVFIILFSMWSPSMFALGEKEQGEEEQDKPTQMEVLNEDEEEGSGEDQEEAVKEDPKPKEEPKEEVVEEETPQPEKKAEEPKKEETKKEEPKKEEAKKEEEKKEEREEEPKIEEDKEILSNLAEDIRPTRHMTFPVPLTPRMATMSNGGPDGSVEVNKTAVRYTDWLEKCRTFRVTLEITGKPPEVPVDVVLILDKSGSMNEKTPIDSAPVQNSGKKYFVKVGSSYSDYVEVTYYSNPSNQPYTIWRYYYNYNWRYVRWDANGNDSSHGNTGWNNPLGKKFYFEETRMDHAKEAAINFAGKVLSDGATGSRVSIVEFSGPSTTSGNGNQNQAQTSVQLTNNITTITNAVNNITAVGGTNTEAGFIQGRNVISGQISNQNPNSKKVVIMFTDGLPTASNGNVYLETTNINHNHFQKAITAAKSIFIGPPKVADVFTVGLLQGMSTTERNVALNFLGQTNNMGFYEAPTAAQLNQIFESIATQINYFAKDAVVVDKIGDNFDLIPGTLPPGASYNPTTREITWEIGTMSSTKTLSYGLQAKPGFEGGQANTNEYANLTYTDPLGNENQNKTFPKPKVDVPTLLDVELTDATIILGESISLGTGTEPSGDNYMSNITGGDGDGTYTYEWRVRGNNDVISTERNPQVSPTADTEYELTVTDSNGCKAVATMWVRVRQLKVTVKKVIDGNYADYDRTFNFKVWINDVEQSGFSLGNNQEKTFENISKNSTIKLKEESEDYEVTVKVGGSPVNPVNGEYTVQVGTDNITIEVTNHKETLVDTGISTDSLPYILVLALAGAVLGFMIIRRRKLHQ